MSNEKTLTYLGILIAINTAFWHVIDNSWLIFVVVNLVTIVICLALSYLEKKLVCSNHRWIDRVVYLFTRNDKNYIVKDKIITYSIVDRHNAKYELDARLKVTRACDDFHYNGRYVWDQNIGINIVLKDQDLFYHSTSEYLKWSNVDIYPRVGRVRKKAQYNVGFKLDNLIISKLSKHSYLSCKVVEKIEHLKLVARVDPALRPAATATLEIQNYLGVKIAPDEIVTYNNDLNAYTKTLCYPRKGRKYIIHWNYEI